LLVVVGVTAACSARTNANGPLPTAQDAGDLGALDAAEASDAAFCAKTVAEACGVDTASCGTFADWRAHFACVPGATTGACGRLDVGTFTGSDSAMSQYFDHATGALVARTRTIGDCDLCCDVGPPDFAPPTSCVNAGAPPCATDAGADAPADSSGD